MIKFIKTAIIVFLLTGSHFYTLANHYEVAIPKDSLAEAWRPSLYVKLSFLPFLDYTPAAQIAVEYEVFDHHSINGEYGYVFGYQDLDFSGHKFRLGYRYYLSLPMKTRLFLGLQVMNKTVNVDTRGYAWSVNRNFQRLYDFKIKNHTQAIYMTSGFIFNISEKFNFETTYGIGRRKLNIAPSGLPAGVEPVLNIQENLFQDARLGETDTPAFFLSLKVGYLIFGNR